MRVAEHARILSALRDRDDARAKAEMRARLAIRKSDDCLPRMEAHGMRFQPSLSGALPPSGANAFFPGGGKALVNACCTTAQDPGGTAAYDAQIAHVHPDRHPFTHLFADIGGETVRIAGRAVIVASGGFQSDLDWLTRAWGPAAANVLIRGTPCNRGVVLKDVLDQGCESVADPTRRRAVAIDGRAPEYGGGIVTRFDCVPFSVVANKHDDRFYDKREDAWPKRYAICGRPSPIRSAVRSSTTNRSTCSCHPSWRRTRRAA